MTTPSKRSGTRAATPPTTLVPPPYGMTAAFAAWCPLEDVLDLARGPWARDGVGHVREDAAQAVDGVEVGLAAGVRGALGGVDRADPPEVIGRRETRRRERSGSNGDGRLGLGLPEADQPDEPGRARADARVGDRGVLETPAPAVAHAHAGLTVPSGADAERPRHPRPRPVGARGRAGALVRRALRAAGRDGRGGRCRHRGAAGAWLAEPRRPRRPAGGPQRARRRARPRPAAAALGAAPRGGRRVVFGRRDVPDPRQHGRWLAGRRAMWLSSWAGRWALGAGGAVEVGENPVQTLRASSRRSGRWRPSACRSRRSSASPTTS